MPVLKTDQFPSYFQECAPLYSQLDLTRVHKHIAIIMDGNGRWAQSRRWARIRGHENAVTAVRESVKACGELGAKVLSLYAFSTENWTRPKAEGDYLFC